MEYTVLTGDCVESMRGLPDNSVHCCVTSPPYWGLRDYGQEGQIGLESTPEAYVAKMVEVFAEVRRVLRPDGTLWLNLGDSYANNKGSDLPGTNALVGSTKKGVQRAVKRVPAVWGLKPKDLVGIPWRVAFALQSDGWYLRQDIIWHKPSPMPESVRDRCTKAHEYVFLLSKSERYFFDAVAISEEAAKGSAGSRFDVGKTAEHQLLRSSSKSRHETGSRNRRSVWTVSTKPYAGAHFATMPWDLAETCILAGTSAEGCCSSCGSPLVRQTARTKLKRERPNAYVKRTGEEGTGNSCANDVAGVAVETIGWRPTCGCNAQVAPAVVLDPFAGSGTTLGVAVAHGRSAVGCELNPDYVGLIDERVKSLYKAIRPVAENRNLPLFDGVCDG